MKKLFLAALSLAALLTTGLISSCGEGSDNKGKEVSGVDKEIKTPVKESKELKIAYIDMDSINSNYKFSKGSKRPVLIEGKSQCIPDTRSKIPERLPI